MVPWHPPALQEFPVGALFGSLHSLSWATLFVARLGSSVEARDRPVVGLDGGTAGRCLLTSAARLIKRRRATRRPPLRERAQGRDRARRGPTTRRRGRSAASWPPAHEVDRAHEARYTASRRAVGRSLAGRGGVMAPRSLVV